MDLGPAQLGKWLITAGLAIALVGVLVLALGKVGLFRLPGDLQFGGRNWRIYIPIASCIIISALLTLLLWLVNSLRR